MLARLQTWIRTATGRNAEVAAARLDERRQVAALLRTLATAQRRDAARHPLVKFQVGLPIAADVLEQAAKTLEG